MRVIVKIHEALRNLTDDQTKIEVHGTTVGECLDELVTRFPRMKERLFNKEGALLNYVDVYVNQESSYPEELAMKVNEGDELSLVLMVAGG
jgi:molybdopterin converting factor small subunit